MVLVHPDIHQYLPIPIPIFRYFNGSGASRYSPISYSSMTRLMMAKMMTMRMMTMMIMMMMVCFRFGAMFFVIVNQCFSSLSSAELFIQERKLFM